MVLMLLVSLGLGTAIQRARERRNAILAIFKLGGRIGYCAEPSDLLQQSDWLWKLLGVEFLPDVETVDLEFAKISHADLVHLKGLTQLDYLNLSNTQVCDAGLVHLKGLTQLNGLGLDNTQVSDAGLVHLKGLTQLYRLELSNTQVSVKGVGELQKAMPNCWIRFN